MNRSGFMAMIEMRRNALRLLRPTSLTKANISFQDHQNEIDVNNLVGFAGIISAGFQIGTLGGGGSKIRMGNAFSRDISNERGLDIGASLTFGRSQIMGGRGFEKCECKK